MNKLLWWLKDMFCRPAIKPVVLKPPESVIIPVVGQTNRTAFLTLIAVSEGTESIGDHGYNALFGGLTFTSYKDHPRKSTFIPRLKIYTTAAGRYQCLEHVFDSYKKSLNLPDFSPASQNAIALQQIKECGALADVDEGRITLALTKCANIWASFPASKYGQPTNPAEHLIAAYVKAGGKLDDWRVV